MSFDSLGLYLFYIRIKCTMDISLFGVSCHMQVKLVLEGTRCIYSQQQRSKVSGCGGIERGEYPEQENALCSLDFKYIFVLFVAYGKNEARILITRLACSKKYRLGKVVGLEYLLETRELRLTAGLFLNLCSTDGVLILCFHAEMSVIRSPRLYFKERSEQRFRSH